MRALFRTWGVLLLATLLGWTAIWGGAMICGKKTACAVAHSAGEESCLIIPSGCRPAPCHFKNLVFLQNRSQADPAGTASPMRPGLAPADLFAPTARGEEGVLPCSRAGIPPGFSPPLYLLKASFIC